MFKTNTEEFKEEFKKNLKTSTAKIKFRKIDQSIREMSCTLSETLLPKMEIKEGYVPKIKTDNLNSLRVWDLDKQSWRSFRLDSLLEYSFEKV